MSIFNHIFSLQKRRTRFLKKMPDSPLRAFYQTPFPTPHTDWREIDILAVDLETTGLNSKTDEILSFGYCTLSNQSLLLGSSNHILTRPSCDIPEVSAVVHGILDDEACNAQPLADVLPSLLQALAGKAMLAHYSPIEYNFIDATCQRLYGFPFICPVIDTLALEAKKLKAESRVIGSGDLRLANARQRYGLPRYPAHNALTDAIAAAELFLAQMAHHDYQEHPRLKELTFVS